MIIKHIENITKNILKELKIKNVAEINLNKIAKSLNIHLEEKELEGNISGLFLQKNQKSYIFYNKNDGKNRQKFTIAHELGHFVLHKKPISITKSEVILFRNEDSSSGEIKREREANSFAASLLMPQDFIMKEISNISDDEGDALTYLAKKFNVSREAMSFRLANLGYGIKGGF